MKIKSLVWAIILATRFMERSNRYPFTRVFTTSVSDSIAHSPADFLIPSIMTSRTEKRASMAYWTTAAIQIGYITTFKSRKAYTDSSYAATFPPELQG